ncbi:hypothetical protein QTP88_020157 [Uroleucon formosanum]
MKKISPIYYILLMLSFDFVRFISSFLIYLLYSTANITTRYILSTRKLVHLFQNSSVKTLKTNHRYVRENVRNIASKIRSSCHCS